MLKVYSLMIFLYKNLASFSEIELANHGWVLSNNQVCTIEHTLWVWIIKSYTCCICHNPPMILVCSTSSILVTCISENRKILRVLHITYSETLLSTTGELVGEAFRELKQDSELEGGSHTLPTSTHFCRNTMSTERSYKNDINRRVIMKRYSCCIQS